MEGFLYLPVREAYIWWGLYMEELIFGIFFFAVQSQVWILKEVLVHNNTGFILEIGQ